MLRDHESCVFTTKGGIVLHGRMFLIQFTTISKTALSDGVQSSCFPSVGHTHFNPFYQQVNGHSAELTGCGMQELMAAIHGCRKRS